MKRAARLHCACRTGIEHWHLSDEPTCSSASRLHGGWSSGDRACAVTAYASQWFLCDFAPTALCIILQMEKLERTFCSLADI